MTRLALLCLFGLLAPRICAEVLGEASLTRPAGYDEGSWQNAAIAASLIHGRVLKPGQSFSYLKAMGSGKNFVTGHSILDGALVSARGGGYCQTSSALYLAALYAGLSIVERHAHSVYLEEEAYFQPGFDSAVSRSGQKDLRFKNPYSYPVTLSATAEAGKVSLAVLGEGSRAGHWLSTEVARVPTTRKIKKSGSEPEGAILRHGRDGFRVKRRLNELDAAGNTRSVELAPDYYYMIPEWVAGEEP